MRDYYNVVLITIDSLRVDHLSLYNYSKDTSPFLREVSRQAIVYKNVYTTAPYTKPAFKSIFTGYLPFSNGAYDTIIPYETLALQFKRDGFFTMGIPNNPVLSKIYGFSKGFDVYFEKYPEYSFVIKILKKIIAKNPEVEKILLKFSDFLARFKIKKPYLPALTLSFLAMKLLDIFEYKIKQKRWFLWLHYMDTHHPYYSPRNYFQILQSDVVYSTKQVLHTNNLLWQFIHGIDVKVEEHDLEYLINLYDAEIRYLDECLRILWEFLEHKNLLDDTVVIITSDHGDEFMEHGGLGHAGKNYISHMYNELLRVPLIIFTPENKKRHEVHREVSLLDLYATIINLARIKTSNTKKGHNINEHKGFLLPPFNEQYSRETIISEASLINYERHRLRIFPSERRAIAIIITPWKYIFYEFCKPKEELYNIEKDPNEEKNIISSHPRLAKIFRNLIIKRIKETRKQHLSLILRQKKR